MILLRNERAEKLALIPTPVGVRPDDAARRERSGDGGKEKAPALIILNPAVVPSVVATRLLRIEKHERNEDDNDDQELQETHTDEQVGEEVLLHGRVAGDADDERSKELANARRTTTHSHHANRASEYRCSGVAHAEVRRNHRVLHRCRGCCDAPHRRKRREGTRLSRNRRKRREFALEEALRGAEGAQRG